MVFMALKPHCSKKARFLPPRPAKFLTLSLARFTPRQRLNTNKLLISLERVEEEELTLQSVEELTPQSVDEELTLQSVEEELTLQSVQITLHRVQ
jgi:hypothetical protein